MPPSSFAICRGCRDRRKHDIRHADGTDHTDAAALVDLTNCDREPIHIPGTIQPHGILFSISVPDLRVVAVSANATQHLAQPAAALLGLPFAALTDDASFAMIAAATLLNSDEPTRLARVRLNGMAGAPLRALLHSTPRGLLLEVKLPQPDPEIPADELFERFDRATRRLQAATDVLTICARLAEEVRRLTGYDRVKVYRFAPDWSGEVVAESNRGNLPSYLGLHFPAADIPVQARALYVRNPERQIPDIGYIPVPLLQADPEPIDLSAADAAQRVAHSCRIPDQHGRRRRRCRFPSCAMARSGAWSPATTPLRIMSPRNCARPVSYWRSLPPGSSRLSRTPRSRVAPAP